MLTNAAQPPANVYEGNGQLSVATPIPGAHPDQVEVVITPDQLRVSADCKYSQEEQNYLRHDWRVGRWSLDLKLPRRVEPGRARATLNLGVLVVMAPISAAGSGEAHLVVE